MYILIFLKYRLIIRYYYYKKYDPDQEWIIG